MDQTIMLKEFRVRGYRGFEEELRWSLVPEVYLFFDCDLHNSRHDLKNQLEHIGALLEFFDDETGNGKLYISYPMIEAIRYTKELPDPDFGTYSVSISQSKAFKDQANSFSHYKSFDFLCSGKEEDIQKRWGFLTRQHVQKVRQLTTTHETESSPKGIFEAQQKGYIQPKGEIAILASLPLFVYDYFRDEYRRRYGFLLEGGQE